MSLTPFFLHFIENNSYLFKKHGKNRFRYDFHKKGVLTWVKYKKLNYGQTST